MVTFNMHILRVVSKGLRPDIERLTLFYRWHLCWKLKRSW